MGYLCHQTQYYMSGFLTGFGIWLVLIGLIMVITNGARSSTPGIVFGVLMMLGGVPVAVSGIRRKKQLDEDRITLQLPAVQPATN